VRLPDIFGEKREKEESALAAPIVLHAVVTAQAAPDAETKLLDNADVHVVIETGYSQNPRLSRGLD